MQVLRRRQDERALQIYLSRGVIQEIGSTHYVRDTLSRIVDDHCQKVGEESVSAPQDSVPHGGCHVLGSRTLEAIDEAYRLRFDPQPDGRGRAGISHAVTAVPRIALLVGEFLAAAGALERHPSDSKTLDGGGIVLAPIGLLEHVSIPLETEGFEGPQDSRRRSGDLARSVHVLHPDQPASAVRTRIEEARRRGVERPQVKIAGG